ncbi:MAG TPA: hypothetical protein VK190_03620 [Pseudoneobacillus sp.]|nr:hypothetical protein [Pseudoneobacillus sp.]
MRKPKIFRKCTNCAGCTSYKGETKLMPDKKVVHEGKADVCNVGNFVLSDHKACELWNGVSKVVEIEGKSPISK